MLGQKFALSRVSFYRVESVLQENTMTLLSTVAALFLLFQASATGTINGSVNGPGTPINLTAGSTVQDVTIRPTPTGTVSGRISDELGQPAVDVPVQLVRVAGRRCRRTCRIVLLS